jgi:predicted naringenin-chalcone synthase
VHPEETWKAVPPDIPRIIGLDYSVPPLSHTQEEVFESLGYPRRWFRLFKQAGIDKRHFALPLAELKTMTFQQQQEAYAHWSRALSAEALEKTIPAGDFSNIGLLVYHSCTGFMPGPSVGHYLAKQFGLRDIEVCSIASMGCDASWPGLRRCYDYTRLTGKSSVLIGCELSGLTYYPEASPPDRENAYELMRANAIFGDACSCALIGYDDNPRHPRILDFATRMDTDYIDRLGYTWREGRLRVRLARDVPEIALRMAVAAIDELLKKNSLSADDITYWILHPAGSVVLDNLQRHYGLPDAKMWCSRKALRDFGNCSSASVGIAGRILAGSEPNPKGSAVMANMGPGMTGSSVLLSFS